ncbi:MAG: hypothetical protein EPO26_11955 [Chloroflexota bacterium]|nr:MAG: hypothetical protein EPO26_11955 [Chloroflexota bacterium]
MNFKRLARLASATGLVVAIGAVGSLTNASAREAAAIPGTFRSSIVVANPGSSTATVSMQFVKSDGTNAMSPVTFTVPANASTTRYVPSITGLADGRYSVVIDSDQSVVAIANLTSDSPSTSTAYNGIAQADVGRSFNIPSAYRNYFGYTSSIIIQNAGTAVANVTLSYRTAAGQVASETRQIPANASSTIDQGATTGLPEGFIGSAVITSDQDIAAIFLVSASTQLSSGRGARAGATSVSLPVIYHSYYGYNTNVLVQNVDTTATTVSIAYYDNRTGLSIGSETATIQPGTSATFFQFDTGRGNAIPRPGFSGSAVVTSTDNKNIIAVANVQHPGQGYLEAYNGFPTSSATTRVSCPAIMKNYYNYNTSLTIQNVGSAATNLTIQYVDANGTAVASVSVTGLAANSGHVRYNPNDAIPVGFNGAVVVTSSGAPIIGVVNELLGGGDVAGDQLFTYACSNS